MGDDEHMELRAGIDVDEQSLRSFAEQHGVTRLAAFGSVLRLDFTEESDIDILVEFAPDQIPGLLRLAQMELELAILLGRSVDLRTYQDLSRYFRDDVRALAREIYSA